MQHHQHHWQIKFVGAGLALVALAGLSGCGKSARSTFTDGYFKETGTHTKTQFSMDIKNLSLTDATSQKTLNSVFGTGKISMTMLLNQKKNQLSLDGKYKKMAGGVIIANDKAYISGDLVASALKAESGSAESGMSFDTASLNKLKGKYLVEKDTDNAFNFKASDSKSDIAFSKAVRKAWMTDFNNFDNKTFKKNGNEITHRLTAKDVTTLSNTYNKVAKSKKSYKDNKVSKSDIKDMKDALKNFKITLGYNTKSNKETVKVVGSDKTDGLKHINVVTQVKSVNTKENVKVPSKANTITEADVEAAIQPKMSNKTFQSILKEYKQLPKASQKSYLNEMKDDKSYFTDSQWQQLQKMAK
ncbi:hypothetical protein AYR62_02600 [Secundilactobacillus paracollinoides]|uniref:Uncharacterized protein n=1 Tax=Secundilactobacillus paracollinoides TaxID=240427 RepID=A0A1B2IUM9_9LACO|nr:hypothetical protein [Secundilactobacillus paracollinoides]ANZ59951.1 hypothetical protein AYR61_00315 [Secundilactobacillus paracollinoides]ANZ63093.1 hypothetical protein AYR62_02600 [Secundilactobacillus paracollinoides]ANZ65742.1 hypothetical protein AYR63_00320 [Secundilactobacillus paracollinoides]